MLGRQENQPGLAELYLWSGKNKPLVDEGSFYDRFAKLRPSLLRDEDFIHWYVEGKGRPSVPPAVVAGAFLLALRDNCSDREAAQRMRYDLRWKWALDLGLGDAGWARTPRRPSPDWPRRASGRVWAGLGNYCNRWPARMSKQTPMAAYRFDRRWRKTGWSRPWTPR